ncbi:mismatch-specific DNA-glycosylase [Actinomycetospora chiangmaiensis]|uniref:mismatch-specific DNA-glycosylase n=1 Tax=Actinomycetospora chiangmaiensis TaxID=402650 RepID=UPI00038103C3|nr:mismatch-specific DNA-glycosylase [Actinomycetospora chiangmaiensis]
MATARRRGPTRAELEAARDWLLPDVLPGADDPPLRVLFSGINPGLVSAYTGHHFARPGNRFWPALHASGFTPRLFAPAEQDLLPALGLGITNVAPRATARADELSDDELRAGGERLRALAGDLRPAWLAVVGVVAYRTAFGEPRAVVGKQERTIGASGAGDGAEPTRLWVLPNPSGLNAHYTPSTLAAEFAALRVHA